MELDIKINISDEEFNKIVEDAAKEYPQYSKEYIISGVKLAVKIFAKTAAEEAIRKGKIRL